MAVRCGHCKQDHPTAAGVRACADQDWAERDAMAAEVAAELGYERWLEDAGSRWDPAGYEHDRRLQAEEDSRRALAEDHYWDRRFAEREQAQEELAFRSDPDFQRFLTGDV